ncbi:hypothetical protein AGMMS50229_05770 [Campylobacterota bacterium]|nr:hypothetical protein AGMMS50229_05770 [Campylobacterota bacterium]
MEANSFIHSGGSATNAANSGIVTIVFPPTAAPPAFAISLSASSTNPAAAGSSDLTATATFGGTPVSGQYVDFNWTVKGGSLGLQAGTTDSTNAIGQTAYTLNGTGDLRTITVTATLQSDTSKTASVDIQFGAALGSSFIALASSDKQWTAAGTYCASQGGKLPLINGSASLTTSLVTAGTPVDGFGTIGGSWPYPLSTNYYFTGTENADSAGNSWVIYDTGSVGIFSSSQTNARPVVCVP